MIGNKSLIGIGVCLIVTIFIAGCASPSTPAPVQTLAPTTVIPTLPSVTSEAPKVTSTVVTTPTTEVIVEKEILYDTGILTTKTYKTYDFKDLGFKFIYPGDKFRITLKDSKARSGICTQFRTGNRFAGIAVDSSL